MTHGSSWIEIAESALTNNCANLRRGLAEGALLGVVIKADAYGHGLALCAEVFARAGADWLIVNSAPEAIAVRAAGVDLPLYVCGRVWPQEAGAITATGARVVLYDSELALALNAAATATPTAVHIKIETGNNRQGLPLSEALELGALVDGLPGLRLEGLTTHFADIEDTTDHRFASSQLESFSRARGKFTSSGLAPPMAHAANSAATILWRSSHAALVRAGIAAYGLWPSKETLATALQLHSKAANAQEVVADTFVPELRAAMAWRARIAQVKDVPAGDYIGYGRTYRATHPSRLAVIPVGYHEGYDRRLSNLAHVLIDGVRCPVRGRVCMNMTMVDVTHVPGARVGSVVTLLGRDGDEVVTAEQLAGWMGSINYEVVSRLHPALPRVLVAGDQKV